RLVLDQPHIDLCFLARRLGLRGGLKRIEPIAGVERPGPLQGLDGWDAVRLWNRWRYGHDAAALELLLAYNEADAMNLQPLADFLYDQLAQQYKPYRDQLTRLRWDRDQNSRDFPAGRFKHVERRTLCGGLTLTDQPPRVVIAQ